MADSLREEIRACIREELERSSNRQVNNRTLVERTRSLIQASSSSASQALGRIDRHRTPQIPSSSGISKRPVPGHPLRFSGKKKKENLSDTSKIIPKSVYLIDEADGVAEEDYSVTDSMILLKAECDLKSCYSEDDVRSELVDVFKEKLPLIEKGDFDFVKRERNTISTPVVKCGHKWDFKHVKHLCGSGKLYVRLNVSKDTLVADDETDEVKGTDDDASLENCKDGKSGKEEAVSNVGMISPVITIDDHAPSTSAGSSFFDDNMASLSVVFPDEDVNTVRDTLMQYEDVELAAQALTKRAERVPSGKGNSDESVAEVLKRLKTGLCSSAEKLKLDEEDLAIDFFQHYKNGEFDPKVPIRVQLKGQPAIDSGGILRQCFSTIFTLVSRNEFLGLRLFTGPSNWLTPVYSSEHILTGVFEVLGKMISHSLVQGGPGFPHLAPAVYLYVATGNLGEAIKKASIVDIADPDLVEFADKVSCQLNIYPPIVL